MPNRSLAVQIKQLHAETVPGTPVTADTILPNTKLMLDIAGDANKVYVPSGYLYGVDSVKGMHWGAGTYEMPFNFCESYILFNSLLKHVNATGATLAKTRVWTPAVNALDTFDTYSVDGGQNGALKKFAYMFFNSLKFTISKQEMTSMTGDLLAQWLGLSTASLASPTVLPSELVGSIMWDAYTATSFTNLAASPTQVTDQWKAAFDFGPLRDTAAFINSANPSWDAPGIGVAPKADLAVTVPFDVSGTDWAGQFTEAKWRAGTPIFLRYVATGAFIENTGTDVYEQLIFDFCTKIVQVPKPQDIKPFVGETWGLQIMADPESGKSWEITQVGKA